MKRPIPASLRALLDTISDGVCVLDAEGKALYANAAAEALLEIEPGGGRGRNLCRLLCEQLYGTDGLNHLKRCPLRASKGESRATFQGGFSAKTRFEWHMPDVRRVEQRKDLRMRCLRLSHIPLSLGEGPKNILFIEDASAQAELRRRKEDWRSMIAHDLRAPLANIHSILNTLRAQAEVGGPLSATAPLVEAGLRSASRMLELLDLYLEVAKFDAGMMPVSLGEVEAPTLAAEAVESQSALARELGVRLETSVPEGLTFHADRGLLLRVLQNLLNNAVKFSPRGKTVRLEGSSEKGVLVVQDEGPGIEEEDIPFIFDRFYQTQVRRKGHIRGNGLGLTFCREAMRAMGGSIYVRSKRGEGSSFILELPKPPASAGAPASAQAPASARTEDAPKP